LAKKKEEREVDEKSPLWADIVALLDAITSLDPTPSIDPDTPLGDDQDGLRLSSLMRRGLSRNWNGMIATYKTGRDRLNNDEAGGLETAGDVWLRIAAK
jgi:hypothetical protein